MTLTRKPFLILIAGGSGSGKTTVAEEIIKNLPTDVSGISICQDRYYLANNSKKSKDVHTFNYDHPNAFD
ncbi:zeta toxin family protein [bacterium]|nr:zeta toxin family protein [bacterium]MBR2651991.1 zeta toxin family protein [bacterium]MBR2858243.1 zeta toxin family protein [bacterium]